MQRRSSSRDFAVIWDLDGVIVDTAPLHFRAWKKAVEERGIPFTKEDFKRTFGMRNREIIFAIFGNNTPESQVAEISERKEAYYRQFVAGNIIPLPGALNLLRALRDAGFRQALASSAPAENVSLIVDSLDIRRLFEVILSEKDVKVGKPDPTIFLTAANRLGVKPVNALVIEDAIAGVQAAKGAGMKCVAVSNTHPADRLRDADMVVDSLAQLSVERIAALLRGR